MRSKYKLWRSSKIKKRHSRVWMPFKRSLSINIRKKVNKWDYFILKKERRREFSANTKKP